MSYEALDKSRWQRFFDVMSTVLEGTRCEIEIVGLDVGDQIQDEWVPLQGISYDPRDDHLIIAVERHQHVIPQPREIQVDWDGGRLAAIYVLDADDHKQFIRMRPSLELPEKTEAGPAEPPAPTA